MPEMIEKQRKTVETNLKNSLASHPNGSSSVPVSAGMLGLALLAIRGAVTLLRASVTSGGGPPRGRPRITMQSPDKIRHRWMNKFGQVHDCSRKKRQTHYFYGLFTNPFSVANQRLYKPLCLPVHPASKLAKAITIRDS